MNIIFFVMYFECYINKKRTKKHCCTANKNVVWCGVLSFQITSQPWTHKSASAFVVKRRG